MHKFLITNTTPTPAVRPASGFISFYADGTFSGEVLVQASPDGSTWFDIADSALTAKGLVNLNVDAAYIRAVNPTAGANLTVWLSGE